MGSNISVLVNRFDHVEFATSDIQKTEKLFQNSGFICTQSREGSEGNQRLMVQGQIRILLNQGRPGTFANEYISKHSDGVCNIAYHSQEAAKTLELALTRGAKPAEKLKVEKGTDEKGAFSVTTAAIKSFGDVRATFVERSRPAFDVAETFSPGFKKTGTTNSFNLGLLSIDHLTNNVEMGTMETWSDFYKNVYGWVEARYFDIKAEQTGLLSKVLQSPDGATKIPVNEGTEKKSQVQEFIDIHKGAGVQHIAFLTNDIQKVVQKLRERGFQFLAIPHSYYEDVPKRMKTKVSEPLNELEKLAILVDGDEKGYLLQIFTQNQIGPMFFEFIQRKGHNGFGEGNFKALFEAIERDQKSRGVL